MRIKKRIGNKKGFTLIELIMVIVVLGVLAAFALPQFFNWRAQARQSAMSGVVGSLRSGLNVVRANSLATGGTGAWPAVLDSAADGAASTSNLFFGDVLQTGISDPQWVKAGLDYTYTIDTGVTCTYTYDPTLGTMTGAAAGGAICP